MSDTEYVVYCPNHKHYLMRVSAGGTTWRDDQSEAKRFPTKPQATKAATAATWRDHNPTPWALPARETDAADSGNVMPEGHVPTATLAEGVTLWTAP